MMLYTTSFRHSRCRNYYARLLCGVQFLRFLCTSHIMQRVEVERMRIFLHCLNDAFVVALLVHLENFSSIHRQRTVNINVNLRKNALVVEVVEHIHDFLCTSNAERRDYQFSATLHASVVDNVVQVEFGLSVLLMNTVTVSCLGNKYIGLRERYWRLYNPVVRTTYIASVCDFSHLAVLFESNVNDSTTEHVTAIGKTNSYAFIYLVVLIVWYSDKNLHTLLGIHVGVNRVHTRKSLLEKFLVVPLDIKFLNEAGIW